MSLNEMFHWHVKCTDLFVAHFSDFFFNDILDNTSEGSVSLISPRHEYPIFRRDELCAPIFGIIMHCSQRRLQSPAVVRVMSGDIRNRPPR